MKKIFLCVVCMFWSAMVSSDTGVTTTTFLETTPQVWEIVPSGDATLRGVYFPQFSNSTVTSSEQASCLAILIDSLSLDIRRYDPFTQKVFLADDWSDDLGLSRTIEIDPKHLQTAVLNVSWVIRVDARGGPVIAGVDSALYDNNGSPPGRLCWDHPTWTPQQFFPGGNVFFSLWIQRPGQDPEKIFTVGNYGDMQLKIPSGGRGGQVVSATMTSGTVIRSSDLGEQFPAKFDLFLQWSNRTSMDLSSSEGTRRLTVTMFPQGGRGAQ